MPTDTIDLHDEDREWWPPREQWPLYEGEDVDVSGLPGRDGVERWRLMHEQATALTLAADYIFMSGPGGMMYSESDRRPAALWVNVNDTFAYACADCEPVPQPEADPDGFWSLYDLVREHGGLGAVAWAARRRNATPLPPVVDSLRAAGLWDDDEVPDAD